MPKMVWTSCPPDNQSCNVNVLAIGDVVDERCGKLQGLPNASKRMLDQSL
jgi:hypothetical protein